jgi:prepilin-type N-terminal cleavage/methylation domain-containing protein
MKRDKIVHAAQAGFTLVELAIVLVVVGLVLVLGTTLIGPLTKSVKRNETKEIVNAAVESIASFASSSKRLPLDPVGDPTAEFYRSVRNSNDAWTKPLLYMMDASLTTIPGGTTDAICGRKSTGYTVCRDAVCTATTNIPNVAFVIVSRAENYNIQTGTLVNGVCPARQTCVRVYETGTPNIDDYSSLLPPDPDPLRAENYDDIVKWVTLDELRTKVGCQGAQLKIVNNELPYGFVNSAYTVTVFADGGIPYTVGVGKYRWCIQPASGSLPAGITATPNTVNGNCSSFAETSWLRADSLVFSGTPTTQNSYQMTIFVRDNNDLAGTNNNKAQRNFVLTINPQN